MEEFFENELADRFETMIENNDEVYFDSEELEDIIIYYLELGDISYAEMAANYGLKLHPNSLEMKTKKLEVLLELEQYTKAKEIIEELRAASMEDTDFLVCCAKYYSNLGNPRRAINYCEKALNLKEEENFLHNFIADEYINLEDPFKALKHYKMALEHDPQDTYALENIMACYSQLNRTDDAVEFINAYIDQYPFSENAWYEYAQFHFNKKQYEEAIRGFDFYLAINSTATGVYANKAACYEAMKQWDSAIAVYEELLEHEFTKAFTYYKIGLCYREKKQTVPALHAFQKSLTEDPQFYLAMMEQSHIYEDMGAMREALHFAVEAVSLNDSSLDYQKRLAFLYIETGQFEESLNCLKKLVNAEPNRFYNWYAYIEVLMLLGEYEDAVTVLQNALQLHHRAELYYQLSNACCQLSMAEEAEKALAIALELDATLYDDMKMKYPELKPHPQGDKKNRTRK